MNWMSWLRDRCLDLTDRMAGTAPGEGRRQPRGRVPGSASEPPLTRPTPGAGS